MNNKIKNNLNVKYSPLPFWLIMAVFSLMAFYLFYNQAIPHDSVIFPSDTAWHLSLAFDTENPSPALIDTTTVKLHTLTDVPAEFIMALLMTLCISGSAVLLRYFIADYCHADSTFKKYQTDFVSVALMLVSAVVLPGISATGHFPSWYLFKFPANVWHNPTYISCKFFAITVFFLVFKSYETFETNIKSSVKPYILLCIFSILCMLAKPSFFIGFMPACCLVMAIQLLTTKFRSFWPSFWCGIAFVPSLLVLLWQNSLYFGQESEAGIVLMPFGLFRALNINMFQLGLNILCGAVFPLYMIYLYFKNRQFDLFNNICVANWFISIAVALFLVEEGERFLHGNMTWTCLSGNFFIFVMGAVLLMQNRFNRKEQFFGWLLFLIHTIYGIVYFIWVCTGRFYM